MKLAGVDISIPYSFVSMDWAAAKLCTAWYETMKKSLRMSSFILDLSQNVFLP